jgi:hypothetical protein
MGSFGGSAVARLLAGAAAGAVAALPLVDGVVKVSREALSALVLDEGVDRAATTTAGEGGLVGVVALVLDVRAASTSAAVRRVGVATAPGDIREGSEAEGAVEGVGVVYEAVRGSMLAAVPAYLVVGVGCIDEGALKTCAADGVTTTLGFGTGALGGAEKEEAADEDEEDEE